MPLWESRWRCYNDDCDDSDNDNDVSNSGVDQDVILHGFLSGDVVLATMTTNSTFV